MIREGQELKILPERAGQLKPEATKGRIFAMKDEEPSSLPGGETGWVTLMDENKNQIFGFEYSPGTPVSRFPVAWFEVEKTRP